MPLRLVQLFAGLVLYGVSSSLLLLAGWLLGGTVGVGTVIYAACIGPLAHIFVPLFSRPARDEAPLVTRASAAWRLPRRPGRRPRPCDRSSP